MPLSQVIVDEQFKSLIPPLTDEERGQLLESLKKEGCRDPLVIWEEEGILIDGHNRYELCLSEAIGFDTVGRSFESRAAAEEWVIRNQFGRRNLTPAQRVELALRLEEAIREKAKANQGNRTDISQRSERSVDSYKELGKLAGVSHDTVAKVKRVLEYAEPETVGLLRSGEISVNQAYKQVVNTENRRVLNETRERIKSVAPPEGKYRCIVMDPPWQMAKIDRDARPMQASELEYPTMTLDEIEALPVPDLIADSGCHLYLWVTQKYLPAGLDLVEAWGFKYQCLLTWVKPTGMTPYSWMYNTEHVIYATVGGLQLERMGKKLSFEAPVTKHSAKPEVFYDIVRECSPGPRLEMFSRKDRDGFIHWGSE